MSKKIKLRLLHALMLILIFALFSTVLSGLMLTTNSAFAATDNVLELEGTDLNGAVLLTDQSKYIPSKSYIPSLDNGFDTSGENARYALIKNGKGAPYVNFYVDTLGDGGYVYKGASQYNGYDAYGFVAGEGEDVYRYDEEKGKDVLVGKQSIAIKLKYNFNRVTNLTGVDGKSWSICDDTWKGSVNGIDSVGVVGNGAVIVQKFVPTDDKAAPTNKSDWMRLNEYSGEETAGVHTVNFFKEFSPEKHDTVTVYSPLGKDLRRGVFIKLTVAYELVHTDISYGWFGTEKKSNTYKNVVEETVFYLCNTDAEVVFNNLYYGDGSTDDNAEENETSVEQKGGPVSNNQGVLDGFRADINGWNFEVTYQLNDSKNIFTCEDGQVFVDPGRYDFSIKTQLGVVRHKTVYIHEKSQDANISVYFGKGLISADSLRVFAPSETYPVYAKNSITLHTLDENASLTKHAPLIGKVYLIDGDWGEIERDDLGLPKERLITEKDANDTSWSFSDLPAGRYEAVFVNNIEFFLGTATGDTYKFVWRFTVVEDGQAPVVNQESLYQQIGFSDYASLHYVATLPSEGEGNILVVFADDESAYYFECQYLASTVEKNGSQFIFDNKTYDSEATMLIDLHAMAHSLVKKQYFDATDISTYTTINLDNIKPVIGENASDEERDEYQELLAQYVPILNRKFDKDVYVFADEYGRENLAVGEPFLNDRLYAYIDESGKLQQKVNPLYFIQVADFETNSITLYREGSNVSYSIPYGVAVQEYLISQGAASGRYKIVEGNSFGTTEYYANYVRPGEITSQLTIERLYNNNYADQTLTRKNDGLRLRANWFKITDIFNELDPYGIIKIKLPDESVVIYQITEFEDIPEFNEVGNYEITLVDRLGNYETFYIDIFTSETVYTLSFVDGDKIISSEVAYGGKNFALKALPTQNGNIEFYGWQDEEGNIYQDFYSFNKPQDTVLKAVWHYTSVSVYVYDGNKVSELTSTVGATLQLPELKKDGYELYGFRYILNDGTYIFYRGQINDVLNVESMRLDAVWKKAEIGSLNISAGVGDNVVITLVDGTVKDTISFAKGEKVQLPKIENQNGLIFSGWVYEYRLKGIVFTDYLTYEEVDSVGLLNRNSIKLTAVYVSDTQQKTDGTVTPVVGAGTLSGNSTPTPGMHINSQTVKSCAMIFGIMLCCFALALAIIYRKRILVFVQKQIAALKLRTQQEMSAIKESSAAQKPVTTNYSFATRRQPFTQRVRAWVGLSTATINKRNVYKKVFFPVLIVALAFVLLFYSQYEFIYNAANTLTASAETYSEQTTNVDEDNKKYSRITEALNIVQDSDSIEDKDIEFLYSNVLVDLMSFGFEDVFTAYAIAGDKRVEGIGYTSYVDAYGDEENYIFGAGFVSLAGNNCLTSEDLENEVKVYVADEEAYYYEYTEFKLTFNQTWGPLHYVAYDKYVQYSVANYIIQPIIANDTGEYNDALGDVYSYDLGDYCHYVNYGQTFDFNAYGITSDMDYDEVLRVYKELIEEQMRSSISVEVEQADFISFQALNDYIAHDQDERFLGVEADALLYYEANIADTQYYVVYENGEVGVLELPPDPEQKATVWERIWMGIASAAGAIVGVVACAIPGVGPVLGGAMISASLDLFMQVTVCGTPPSKIDWGSVLLSAVIGGVTGGIGQVGSALTKGAIAATKSVVKQTLIKLGTQVVSGMIGGSATYLISMAAHGEEFSFKDFAKSVGLGVVTGAMACLGGAAIEKIASKSNALFVTLQIVSGSLVSAAGYLLSIAVTGQEFSWTDFIVATAMGAATATIMVIGGKIVKTIKTAQAKRAEAKALAELTEIEKNSTDANKMSIEEKLKTEKGLNELIKKYPDKAEKWQKDLAEIKQLQNSGSELDAAKANRKLNILKGTIFEHATGSMLEEQGFRVEINKETVNGPLGKTRPDIIAYNDTDNSIEIFGKTVKPGEKVYVECKCGTNKYIASEAQGHLDRQLAGHMGGRSFLVTTSTNSDVQEFIKIKYSNSTTLVPLDIGVGEVNNLLSNYGG